MNMFDGIDGLVGSVCFAGLCMFIAAALYAGSPVMEINQFIVLGALAGFLLFNMRFPWQPRAKTFLGDAGSGFVGFTLAYIAISLTQPVNHPISPVLGPFLLAPPIIDCLVLIAHRMRKGKSPFCAGRDHVHHLMLEAGFGVTQIVAILTGLSCISGLFGALCMLLNVPAPLMVMAYLTAIFIWFWITETEQRAISYFQWLQKRFSVLFNVKSPA
jgi:UDP-GlcNAc:undecaprenyl-phosphate/decaprenyl-phosphate GlcNAc-1-phosphate transferase